MRGRSLLPQRRLCVLLMVALALVGSVAPRTRSASERHVAIGLRVMRLIDRTRTIRLPNGHTEPRILVTYVRYPAVEQRFGTNRVRSPAERGRAPFPLIVFGHGFAVTPSPYSRLLRAWASAGYVVAAPVFPLENANAPGGPNEADLVNQPEDVRFVISRLLASSAAAQGALKGLIDPARIAIAGHSDGGETALAVAYDRRFLDRRVRAAVILSGARIPGGRRLTFSNGTPLLATQGTGDSVNPPSFTHAFYDIASRPKFLLTLARAGHLPPYTYRQPQLGVVERVTIAFLNRYFKRGSLRQLLSAGTVPGVARLEAKP